MAVQVKVPTILRTYTGGAKAVEASGDTLDALLSDVDSRYEGLRGRLIAEDGSLHRFVNVYINNEDVRFLGALEAPAEGRRHGHDPAARLPAGHPPPAESRALREPDRFGRAYPTGRPAAAVAVG